MRNDFIEGENWVGQKLERFEGPQGLHRGVE